MNLVWARSLRRKTNKLDKKREAKNGYFSKQPYQLGLDGALLACMIVLPFPV